LILDQRSPDHGAFDQEPINPADLPPLNDTGGKQFNFTSRERHNPGARGVAVNHDGTSASQRLIRRVRWFVNGVRIIAPLISGQRIVARNDSGTDTNSTHGILEGVPDSLFNAYASNILSSISSRNLMNTFRSDLRGPRGYKRGVLFDVLSKIV